MTPDTRGEIKTPLAPCPVTARRRASALAPGNPAPRSPDPSPPRASDRRVGREQLRVRTVEHQVDTRRSQPLGITMTTPAEIARVQSVLARYRAGRSDTRALKAAVHDVFSVTDILEATAKSISRGLDRGRSLATSQNIRAQIWGCDADGNS